MLYFPSPYSKSKFHRFEKTARSAFQNEDYSNALLTSKTCYLIKPESIEPLKILVNSAEKLQHPGLKEWSQKLAEHENSSKKDKIAWIERCISSRDIDSASLAIKTFANTFPEDEYTIYFSCLLEKSKSDEQAIYRAFTLAEENLDKFPNSEKIHSIFGISVLIPTKFICWNKDLIALKKSQTSKYIRASSQPADYCKFQICPMKTVKSGLPKCGKWKNQAYSMQYFAWMRVTATKHEFKKFPFYIGSRIESLVREQNEEDLATILNRVGRPEMTKELLNLKKIPASENKEIFKETIRSALHKKQPKLVSEPSSLL